MKTVLRILGGPLFIGLLMLASFATTAGTSSAKTSYALPLSPALTCSPAPCVLPNVQASEGGSPVNDDPIAANPKNSQQLLTGGSDYNCSSLLGFYASNNSGTTWNHTCMNVLSGASGYGEPGVGYDLKNTAYISGIDSNTPDGYDHYVCTFWKRVAGKDTMWYHKGE